MSKASTSVTIDINARLNNLDQIMAQLKAASSQLNLDKETSGKISDIENRLKALRSNAVQDINSNSGFTAYFKELNAILTDTRNIQNSLAGGFNKILSPQEKQIIKDVSDALDAYTTKTQAQIKAEEDLAKAQQQRAQAEEALTKAQNANKAVPLLAKRNASKEYETKKNLELKAKNTEINAANKELDNLQKKGASSEEIKKQQDSIETLTNEYAKLAVQIDQAKREQKQLDKEIFKLTNQKDFNQTSTTDLRGLSGKMRSAVNAENKAQANLDAANTQATADAFTRLQGIAQSLPDIDLSKFTNPSQFNDLATAVQNSVNAMISSKPASDQMSDGLQKIDKEVKQTKDDIDANKNALDQQNKALGEISQVKSRIEYFFSLQNAIMLASRAIKQAFNDIKELDKAMTETAIVTDFSVGDMWDKLPQYTAEANKLGVSIKSLYESTTLYYQQGLDSNQAMQLSVETMKMARIAGLDAATATDRMTNALRAFKMELNDVSAQRVNDVYSQVAAMSASNVDELSTAMTKVASLAANVGMTFEQTTAYLATGIETTRESADAIGTALKTVLARFAEMKKDPTLQEAVDGETVDVNKVETALRSVGIALRDSSGEFRNMGDVFQELNKKWNTLTTSQQRYVATMAAGSRQQSRFIAMMSDSARTMELYNAALDSTGASQKQYSKTLESLETKLQKLTNAWQQFTLGITNNDLLKGAVDLLTGFISLLNKLSETFGSTGKTIINTLTAITAFSIGKSVLASVSSSMLLSMGVSNVTKQYTLLEIVLKSHNKTLDKTILKTSGLTKIMNTLSASLNSGAVNTQIFSIASGKLNVQWKLLGQTVGKLALKFIGIIMLIKAVVAIVKGIKEQINNAKTETKLANISESISTINSNLSKTSEAISELGSISSTLDEYQEKLANLTVGSAEWTAALIENNQKVLELASTYDKLELTTNSNGALTITDDSIKSTQDFYQAAYTNQANALSLMRVKEAELSAKVKAESAAQLESRIGNRKGDAYYDLAQQLFAAGQKSFTNSSFTQEETVLVNEILQELQNQTQLERASLTKIAKSVVESKYTTLSSQKQELVATASAISAQNSDIISKSYLADNKLMSGEAQKAADAWRSAGTVISGIGAGVAAGGLAFGPGGWIASALGATVAFLAGPITEAVAENIEADARKEFAQEAIANGTAPEGLEYNATEEAFTYLGEVIEDTEAIYLVQQEVIANKIDEISENVAKFTDERLNNKQSEILTQILSGQRNNLTRQFLENPQHMAVDFERYFGMSMTELATSLGLTLEEFQASLNSAMETEYNYQVNAREKATRLALSNGRSESTIRQIVELDADSIDVLNNLTDAATSKGNNAIKALYDVLNLDNLNDSGTAEFLTWLNSTSFDTPISGFQNINDALTSNNQLIKSFAKEYYELNTADYSASSQLQYLLTASTYDDLNKELDKLYKKNKQILGSDVSELAQSYEDLNDVLEKNNISAASFAQILTAIYKQEISITGITDTLITTLNKFSTVASQAFNMEDAIESFGKSISSFAGSDFLADKYDQFKKEVEAGSYGSNFITEYLNYAFDTTNLDKALKNYDENAVKDFVSSKLKFLQKISLQDGKDFWIEYAQDTSNQIAGFTATYISDTKIQFDAIGKTYNELLKNFQEKYGVTESIANMMLQSLLAYDPVAAQQINDNSFTSAIYDLIKNATGDIKVLTKAELQTIAGVYNKTLLETEAQLALTIQDMGVKAQIVDYSGYNANNLTKDMFNFAKSNTTGVMAGGQEYYDPEELRKTLTAYGFDATQIDALIERAVNEFGLNIGRVLTQYSTDENGEITSTDYVISAETVGDLETKYAGAITKADYSQQAKTFIDEFDKSGIGENIAAIRAKLDATLVQDKDSYDKSVDNYIEAYARTKAQEANDYTQGLVTKYRGYEGLSDQQLIAKAVEIFGGGRNGMNALNNKKQEWAETYGQSYVDNNLAQLLRNYVSDMARNYDTNIGTESIDTSALEEWFEKNYDVYGSFTEALAAFEEEQKKTTEATKTLGMKVDGVEVNSEATAESQAVAYASVYGQMVSDEVKSLEKDANWNATGITDADRAEEAKSNVNNKLANQGLKVDKNGNIVKIKDVSNDTKTTAEFNKSRDGSDNTDHIEHHYDWLYNILQKINKLEHERTMNQSRLNLLLHFYRTESEAVAEAARANVENIKQSYIAQAQLAAGRKQEVENIQAEGKAGFMIRGATKANGEQVADFNSNTAFDITKLVYVENGQVKQDYDAITKLVADADFGSEYANLIDEYTQRLEKALNDWYAAEEAAIQELQNYYDAMTQGENAYKSLIGKIANALQEKDQKVVDKLNETNDAINKLDSDIVNAVQENITAIRRDRDRENTEENLSNLQRRIAYLQQDTTGANKKTILELQKQLNQDTLSYQDQLVDDALDNIQKQNEKAAEQRESQIELLQSQVDWNEENGTYHKKAEKVLIDCYNSDHSLNIDGTNYLYSLMKQTRSWKGLSDSEMGLEIQGLNTELGDVGAWAAAYDEPLGTLLDDLKNGTYITKINDKIDELKSAIVTSRRSSDDDDEEGDEEGESGGGTGGGTGGETGGSTIDPDAVKKLQQYLNDYNGANLAVDGKYGNKTIAAVKELQRMLNRQIQADLKVDGKYGQKTATAWDEYLIPRHRTSAPAAIFAKGGLADFTGPAWLDGTKSSPELVLNAQDTKNFIVLKDTLAELSKNGGLNGASNAGTYGFNININVDELGNDYDVTKLSKKVQDEITQAMAYRNVTSVKMLK